MRRRDLLILLAAIGAAVALPPVLRRRGRSFDFEPLPGLPGFRRLQSGAISGGSGGDFILTGLHPASARQTELRQQVVQAPCQAVFDRIDGSEDRLPVAVFTDYNCPYCPDLSGIVVDLIETGAPIAVTWHDLPVLGPRSEAAARAAIAAGAQGQYLPVHQRLMRGVLRPGDASLVRLATDFGMDPDRFLRDVTGPATENRLERSAAVAAVFGIIGTPSLLVGRTLVVGEITRDELLRLIELEQAVPFAGCPAG